MSGRTGTGRISVTRSVVPVTGPGHRTRSRRGPGTPWASELHGPGSFTGRLGAVR